ncbi:DUF2971 domain-containing protein [Klebsiella pneumoniae]|mgnify:CR=1 FL=1|nr:DUF2971 domain-containing protein [Klebsiella pneumoniae]
MIMQVAGAGPQGNRRGVVSVPSCILKSHGYRFDLILYNAFTLSMWGVIKLILYKYLSQNVAAKVIKNPTMRFTPIGELNDPFEATSSFYENEGGERPSLVSLSYCYGALSLSRNPLNPVMWSHYAIGRKYKFQKGYVVDRNNKSHAGVVIGIDAESAELNSDYNNVLPAKYGSVIYTCIKPVNSYTYSANTEISEGELKSFNINLFEALQRIFLMKAESWSYENEVRVIRNVLRGDIHPIPRKSIKEVYIGYRNSQSIKYLIIARRLIKKYLPDVNIYVCAMSDFTWEFEKVEIGEHIKNITFNKSHFYYI